MKNHPYISVVAICLGIMSCSNNPSETVTSEKEPQKTAVILSQDQIQKSAVSWGQPEQGSLNITLRLNGVTEAPVQNRRTISAPMGGFLKKSDLLPGMKVQKGEVIAVLEDPQYIQIQQDYLHSAVRLKMLEADFFRQKELSAANASSEKVFQQAEAAYKGEKINLGSLAEKLRFIGINPASLTDGNISGAIYVKSPVHGYVSRVHANPGKYVNAAEPLFEIVDPSELYLNLRMYEKDLSNLKEGQTVSTWPHNNPSQKMEARIFLIDRYIEDDHSMEVRCKFTGSHQNLIPGQYMNAEIITRSDSGLLFPDDAIITSANRHYIFVHTGKGNFELVAVEKISSAGGKTALRMAPSGLPSGSQPVLKGTYTLWLELNKEQD